jgi:putative hemolysin
MAQNNLCLIAALTLSLVLLNGAHADNTHSPTQPVAKIAPPCKKSYTGMNKSHPVLGVQQGTKTPIENSKSGNSKGNCK